MAWQVQTNIKGHVSSVWSLWVEFYIIRKLLRWRIEWTSVLATSSNCVEQSWNRLAFITSLKLGSLFQNSICRDPLLFEEGVDKDCLNWCPFLFWLDHLSTSSLIWSRGQHEEVKKLATSDRSMPCLVLVDVVLLGMVCSIVLSIPCLMTSPSTQSRSHEAFYFAIWT